MDRSSEELEHFSRNQDVQKNSVEERPIMHRVISWILIMVVLFAFLGTCYWLAFYGRV